MAVVRNRGNGRVVDLGDKIAADKTMSSAKLAGSDLGDQHTLYLESGAARAICSDIPTRNRINWRRSIVAIAAVRGVIRENLCAIRDRQAGFMLFLRGHRLHDIIPPRWRRSGSQGRFHCEQASHLRW